jgi:hypothetical protein
VIVVYRAGATAHALTRALRLLDKLKSKEYRVSQIPKEIRPGLAWSLVLNEHEIANPDALGPRVAAACLPGYEAEAQRLCQLAGCTDGAIHVVTPREAAMFTSNFQGRQVALFVHSGAPDQSPESGNTQSTTP